MPVLIENETSTTSLEVRADIYNGAPTFDISIVGGTATIEIYQGNIEGSVQVVSTITTPGIYIGAGICGFFGAKVTAISGATVNVTVSEKAR